MKKRIISSVLAISMLTLIISVCAGCSKMITPQTILYKQQ